jgi:uncharacterized protein (TIGR02996 family)
VNDLEALRRAIVLNPAEDTPRLAFADALDEAGGKNNAGHARAIRLMTEWERRWGEKWVSEAIREFPTEFARFKKGFLNNYTSYMRCRVKVERPSQGHRSQNPPIARMLREFVLALYSLRILDAAQNATANTWWCHWQFRRGFVTRIKCHWPHWELYGDDLVENEPIEHVELTSPVILQKIYPAADLVEWLSKSYPRVVSWKLSDG